MGQKKEIKIGSDEYEDILKEVEKLNKDIFGKEDYYSKVKNFKQDHHIEFVRDPETQKIVAYIILEETEYHISGHRSGVHKDYRNMGYGKYLYKKVLKRAKRLGIPYRTYVAIKNYKSINVHIKAGMRIYHISGDWVYLES